MHEQKVFEIQQELKAWKETKKPLELPFTHHSNMMRKKKFSSPPLSFRSLDQVIEIDAKSKTAWVEPGVSMERLVEKTLQYNLIPEVVPEFKGITVGGAINGAALESSSHLYGQFNDQCLSYEILTGDGTVLVADRNNHRELFYAIPGSFGTLGILLSVKINLMETTPNILLNYHRFKSFKDAIDFMALKHQDRDPPDFMEGIAYSQDLTVVVLGNFTRHEIPNKLSLKYPWSCWFYQHARFAEKEELIPIKEYLFRHDRGAFWMGGYASPFALSYLSHKSENILGGLASQLSEKFMPLHAQPVYPSKLFRMLFGGFMDSQRLYKSLHSGSEQWFEKHFVIQDFYLPQIHADEFTDYALNRYKIVPIWICPIKSATTPQIFSPHYSPKDELLFDIGIYGYPYRSEGPTAVRDLEAMTYNLGGRKMFYCYSYLEKEKFWQIYSEEVYNNLRARYQLESISKDITEKILNN